MGNTDKQEKNKTPLGSEFDEYRNKEYRRFLRRVAGWIVLFLVAAVLIVSLFKTCNRVEDVEGKVQNLTDSSCQMKILIDSTAKDTIHFISRQDVQILVNDAADKKTSAYIDQQGHLIALYVGIMAFFALIVTIMVPLMINNRQKEEIKSLLDKQEDKFEKQLQNAEKTQSSREQKLAEMNKQLEELANRFASSESQSVGNTDRDNVGRKKSIVEVEQQKISNDDKQSGDLNGCENNLSDDNPTKSLEKTQEELAVDNAIIMADRQAKLKSQAESIIKETQAQIAHDEDLERIRDIGDSDKKINELKESIEKTPGNPLVRYCDLSKLYAEKSNWEDAIIWVKSALSIDKEFVDAYIQLADVLLQKNSSVSDFQEAWINIEKAQDINPGSLVALDLRSKILSRLGFVGAAKNSANIVYNMALKETKVDMAKEAQNIMDMSDRPIDDIDCEVEGVKFTMKGVEGGGFTMGAIREQGDVVDDDEYPAHKVLLSNYYIGETVVTQVLWKAVMGYKPSRFKGDNLPVDSVSWNDVTERFIPRLNSKTGRKFRLPTEAEWEFAARGGNKTKGYKYSGSDDIDEVAWYVENSDGETHPVKGKKPNELGLYDMSGNVLEWCQDKYGKYSDAPIANPTGPERGEYRVLRGGNYGRSEAFCRVAVRGASEPDITFLPYGFRLALDASSLQEEGK